MAVRDGRSDVKQTTTGFRGPLMVQSLTSAKSKFLSLAREGCTISRCCSRTGCFCSGCTTVTGALSRTALVAASKSA